MMPRRQSPQLPTTYSHGYNLGNVWVPTMVAWEAPGWEITRSGDSISDPQAMDPREANESYTAHCLSPWRFHFLPNKSDVFLASPLRK